MYILTMKGSRKEVILDYLMSMSSFVSGEELAAVAHCTPQNVSAHIRGLRGNGYDIEVSHRGYRYNREPENRLALIKERFADVGIHFEHIRSCIDLLNVVKKEYSSKKQRLFYYTFNEMDVPHKRQIQGLSFAISDPHISSLRDSAIDLLSTYLGEKVTTGGTLDSQGLYYGKYIIGRYRKIGEAEYFYLQINNRRSLLFADRINLLTLSDILGDYIGIKGFSVLIFEHLYAILFP